MVCFDLLVQAGWECVAVPVEGVNMPTAREAFSATCINNRVFVFGAYKLS